jgi:hypothetical protein
MRGFGNFCSAGGKNVWEVYIATKRAEYFAGASDGKAPL